MQKRKSCIEKALEYMVIFTFTALIAVVFLQVFARFFLPKAPSWTEEASRFFFIYSIAFGAPLALKRGEYVRVDILINMFPKRIQDILDGIIYLVLTIFFLIITYCGYTFGSLGLTQTSPAMGLPMYIPYMSIGLSGAFLTVYGILKAIERFKGKGRIDILAEVLENGEVID